MEPSTIEPSIIEPTEIEIPPIGTIVRVWWLDHVGFDEAQLSLPRREDHVIGLGDYEQEGRGESFGEILCETIEYLVLNQGRIGSQRKGMLLVKSAIRGIEILKDVVVETGQEQDQS